MDAAPYRSPGSPDVPDHGGKRQTDAVYWAAAEPAVGRLLSAWSNQTHAGFNDAARLARVRKVSATILGGFLGLLALAFWGAYGAVAGAIAGGATVAVVAALLLFGFRPRPWCSYVGEDGMSDHRSGKNPRVLRFADARGLWIRRTDHIENGFYRHTRSEYIWRNDAGQVLLEQSFITVERGIAAAGARFGARAVGGPFEDPNRTWLEAGARRWHELRRNQLERQLKENGAATFMIDPGGYLAVRLGEIEVSIDGDRRTAAAGDVAQTSWKQGVLTIQLVGGAKPIRLRGADVADLELALEHMRAVANLPIES